MIILSISCDKIVLSYFYLTEILLFLLTSHFIAPFTFVLAILKYVSFVIHSQDDFFLLKRQVKALVSLIVFDCLICCSVKHTHVSVPHYIGTAMYTDILDLFSSNVLEKKWYVK